MGAGFYSTKCHVDSMGLKSYSRADDKAHAFYASASPSEIFKQSSVNNAMSPKGVKIRESRDSKEHPNSLAILLALDVTGSMRTIPHHLIKEGLPNVMGSIIEKGIKDPQVLFVGIGDHECGDRAPLQVGQFESSDELLDKWLETIYLEGGGGGNDGESYLLAWYFAAKHTSIDCFEKRKEKGFLFTIGDEPCLKKIPASRLKEIMGEGQFENFDARELLDQARKAYNVYHIHIGQGNNGQRQDVKDGWKQLMGDGLIICENYEDVPKIISDIVTKDVKVVKPSNQSKEENIIL